jgi:hypothetical protein
VGRGSGLLHSCPGSPNRDWRRARWKEGSASFSEEKEAKRLYPFGSPALATAGVSTDESSLVLSFKKEQFFLALRVRDTRARYTTP